MPYTTFDRCVLVPFAHREQYQYGLFTARVLLSCFTRTSYHATIAFGRLVQRTSSTLKSLHLDRSIDLLFHACDHAKSDHLYVCGGTTTSRLPAKSTIHPLLKASSACGVEVYLARRSPSFICTARTNCSCLAGHACTCIDLHAWMSQTMQPWLLVFMFMQLDTWPTRVDHCCVHRNYRRKCHPNLADTVNSDRFDRLTEAS